MGGWGSVLGAGLLGAIGGGAQAAGKVAEDERKAEIERLREERLSQLRMQEYKAKGDIDIANIPRKSAAEIPGKVAEQEALTPGLIERSRQEQGVRSEAEAERDRSKIELGLEYADDAAKAKAKETTLVEAAKLPFKLAEIGAQGANQIKVAEVQNDEAAKRDWTEGADGKYYDAKGRMITTSVKIEGRMETIPVMVPASKMGGRDANWKMKEELDSLNKRIESAERNPMGVDEALMRRLLAEKDRLLGKPPGAASANRPPLTSFQK